MQKDMTYHMLATFSEAFRGNPDAAAEERRILQEARGDEQPESKVWHGTDLAAASPEEMEGVLADTVLKEFKTRLGRIGLEYQTPIAP